MCDWDESDEFTDDDGDFGDDLSADFLDEDEVEKDAFAAGEKFFFGGAMGFAYEEGLEERKRRWLLKKKGKKKSEGR